MSIYSGFATRNLQETYDHYVYDMLFILQKRILKFYENIETDQDKFWSLFSQLYHQMIHLEKNKYLEPKSSQSLTQVYEFLKNQKEQRDQDPQEDLKKFQRSMALKINPQEQTKIKETQINNFIRRSAFSFGKIKKQIDPEKMTSLSVQTINRKVKAQLKTLDEKFINSEQKITFKREFSSQGNRKAKSFRQQMNRNLNSSKTKVQGYKTVQQVVRNYLQKTNKNYLRGYRKRKVIDQYLQNNGNTIDLKLDSDYKR